MDADLKDLRDRFDYATQEWSAIKREARTDMRYVAGDPWDENDRRAREDAGRPCLSLDELGQYFNQTINGLRLNPRGMIFTPTGNGANDDTAKFYEAKAREIEYRSHAQLAYLSAAENMIQRSYGWVRVNLVYESARSRHKDLVIEAIPNPDMVTPDPDAKRPDFSDMEYLFFDEQWPVAEFRRKFPDAKIRSFSPEMQQLAPKWLEKDHVRLAEYWAITYTPRTLRYYDLPNGQPLDVFVDELEQMPAELAGPLAKLTPSGEREVQYPTVRMQLTNGLEILEETDWPGKYIPFVAALGKVLYVDEGAGAKRQILSMTRLARDAYMAYCYYRTSEIETVGMVTKNPYWAYEGQLSRDQMLEIQKSMHQPVAVLLAKPMIDSLPPGAQPLPLPQGKGIADIQALSMGAEEMRRGIQAAMGISPMPTQAQRQNEKSGIALQQIESSGQTGAYHFVNAYENLIRQTGVVIEDLIDKVYDTARDVGIRPTDDTAKVQRINDPNSRESVSTRGDHQVTISAGPAKESERQAADDFVDDLAGMLPVVAQITGPQVASGILSKAIKLKRLGPIGDQMADLIEPPELKANDGKPPDPKIAQLQQQVQQVTEQLKIEELQRVTEQAKYAGQLAIEQLKQRATTARELALKRMEMAGKIETARITAAKQSADLTAEALEERIALGAELDHEAREAMLDRAHERAMAAYTTAMAPGPTAVQ